MMAFTFLLWTVAASIVFLACMILALLSLFSRCPLCGSGRIAERRNESVRWIECGDCRKQWGASSLDTPDRQLPQEG